SGMGILNTLASLSIAGAGTVTLGKSTGVALRGTGALNVNGGTVVLSGSNTTTNNFTGNVSIASGSTLQVANTNALGTIAGGTTLGTLTLSGGTLESTAVTASLANPYTISGSSTISTLGVGDSLALSGMGTLNTPATLSIAGAGVVTLGTSTGVALT